MVVAGGVVKSIKVLGGELLEQEGLARLEQCPLNKKQEQEAMPEQEGLARVGGHRGVVSTRRVEHWPGRWSEGQLF